MDDMKIWTGWADISATGEGRTICSMIAMAQDEAGFRARVREVLGAYVEKGFDVSQGVLQVVRVIRSGSDTTSPNSSFPGEVFGYKVGIAAAAWTQFRWSLCARNSTKQRMREASSVLR